MGCWFTVSQVHGGSRALTAVAQKEGAGRAWTRSTERPVFCSGGREPMTLGVRGLGAPICAQSFSFFWGSTCQTVLRYFWTTSCHPVTSFPAKILAMWPTVDGLFPLNLKAHCNKKTVRQ